MELLNLLGTYLIIISGDLALHHPDWDEMRPNRWQRRKQWQLGYKIRLFRYSMYIAAQHFHQQNRLDHSVCDLMVANARAIGGLLVSRWKVDEEERTGSNRVMIQYTIADKRVLISKWQVYPDKNENLWSSTAHQMARCHIRLETLV